MRLCHTRVTKHIASPRIGYAHLTVKRFVDVDNDLLERARSIAGTDTIKDTVNTALRRLVDDERVLRHIERLKARQ